MIFPSMNFIRSSLTLSCLVLWSISGRGQMRSENHVDWDLFDRMGKRQGPKGWTVLAGASGLLASPRAMVQTWALAGLASDGTWTVPDTMYSGQWTFRGQPAMALGVGRWTAKPEKGLVDRSGWLLSIGNQRVEEAFVGVMRDSLGRLQPDTILQVGQAFNIRLQLHVSRAFSITRDIYADVRAGIGLHQDFGPTTRGGDSLFVGLADLAQTRIGIDLAAGIGVRIWSGRHARFMISTRAFQLHPVSRSGKANAFDWMSGSYRPWSLMLALDLQQPRPPTQCGQPSGSIHQPGRNLFGPVMRKRYRWSQ